MWTRLEYQFPPRYISTPLKFLKNLKIATCGKAINFQDLTFKGDFHKYCGRAVFISPETLLGNQYLKILTILVSIAISAKLESYCSSSDSS